MNDRLLKKLILKEIHSVLNEKHEDGFASRLKSIIKNLEEASKIAERMGQDAVYGELRTALGTIGDALEMYLSDEDEGEEEEPSSGEFEPEYREDEDEDFSSLQETKRKRIRRR